MGLLLKALSLASIIPVATANYEWLAGYEPRTLVTDHAAIDFDQRELERWIDEESLQATTAIYEQGGYSQSVARLKLSRPLPPDEPIPEGTIMYGYGEDGQEIRGKLAKQADWDHQHDVITIYMNYDANKEQANYSNCQVGGLIIKELENTKECLQTSGEIHLLVMSPQPTTLSFNYTYDLRHDNYNARTIQSFSTDAGKLMWNCSTCPLDTYSKFVKYYGSYDYGDKWVSAALGGHHTRLDNGNANFNSYDRKTRFEGVKIAAKFMNIHMFMIRQLEYAIEQCNTPCFHNHGHDLHVEPLAQSSGLMRGNCYKSHINAWDQAVAFYVGSLEGEDGQGEGVLLHALADLMCEHFKTCGNDASSDQGVSYNNNEMVRLLQRGQDFLNMDQCEEASETKQQILSLVHVPLIQATLLLAHNRAYHPATQEEDQSMDQVQGATYAATVLPLVHACDQRAATTIYNNLQMKYGEEDLVDFPSVKRAFESAYSCMGVSCEAVGGIWEGTEYSEHGVPCKDPPPFTLVLLLSIGGAVLAALLLGLLVCRIRTGRDKNFEEDSENRESTGLPEDVLENIEID